MSVFGFDTAITTQSHFGTGFTNLFDISNEVPCTLDLCDLAVMIQECCDTIVAPVINVSGSVVNMRRDIEQMKVDLRLLIASMERMKKGRL